jgi:hypothetical protein
MLSLSAAAPSATADAASAIAAAFRGRRRALVKNIQGLDGVAAPPAGGSECEDPQMVDADQSPLAESPRDLTPHCSPCTPAEASAFEPPPLIDPRSIEIQLLKQRIRYVEAENALLRQEVSKLANAMAFHKVAFFNKLSLN